MTPTSIETVTGSFVDLVHPSADSIHIEDIAWAISRMPRYVAHTVSEIPYTIGQHSIFVADLVVKLFDVKGPPGFKESFYRFINEKLPGEENADLRREVFHLLTSPPDRQLLLNCLMHDASEAYIVDVPTPLKQSEGFRQVYAELEDRMMRTILLRFNIYPATTKEELIIKWADAAALTIEAYHLIKSRGANWTRLLPLGMSELQVFEQPKAPIKVYEEFLNYFKCLME